MRWFRSHIRLGCRLALFALAAQLVLTFGHVDLDGAVSAAAKAAGPGIAGHFDAAVSQPADPSQRSDGAPDFGCPICALIQLASTSAPALAPVLPVPAKFVVVRPELPVDLVSTAAAHFFFQARGPPST